MRLSHNKDFDYSIKVSISMDISSKINLMMIIKVIIKNKEKYQSTIFFTNYHQYNKYIINLLIYLRNFSHFHFVDPTS